MYVIYVRETTDERIFQGADWTEQLGNSAVESYHWYPPDDPDARAGTWEDRHGELPRIPDFEDDDIEDFDIDDLAPGDAYPGKYAGHEYHVDSSGRPFRKVQNGRRFLANMEVKVAARRILDIKRGGKFVITPDQHIVAKVQGKGLVFMGVLSEPLRYEEPSPAKRQDLQGAPPTFEDLFGK